jgi:nicotinate-nucleotide adenylyltransferase
MNIGLYFGSFNPIHHGHLIIAQHLLNETDIEQVWMVISPQNPFKPQKQLLNEYHRLHLVHLAIGDNNRIKASDIEFGLPKPSYTIDTITYLKEKYPQHNFSIIMGSDGLQNLDKWKNASKLMQENPFYVYRRPGFEVIQKPVKKLIIVDAPLLEISATHIRELIRQQKSIRYLVPDSVIEELKQNNYYKNE